jgi:hypothetical protein
MARAILGHRWTGIALVAIGALVLPRDRAEGVNYISQLASGKTMGRFDELRSLNGKWVAKVLGTNCKIGGGDCTPPEPQFILIYRPNGPEDGTGSTIKWKVQPNSDSPNPTLTMRSNGFLEFNATGLTRSAQQIFPSSGSQEQRSGSVLRLDDDGDLYVYGNGSRTWGTSGNPDIDLKLESIAAVGSHGWCQSSGSSFDRSITALFVYAKVTNRGNLTAYNARVRFRKTSGGPLLGTRDILPGRHIPPGETRQTGDSFDGNAVTIYTASELVNMAPNCSGTIFVPVYMALLGNRMDTWGTFSQTSSRNYCTRIRCTISNPLQQNCGGTCTGCRPITGFCDTHCCW